MDTIEFIVAKKNIFEFQDIGVEAAGGLPSQAGYYLRVAFKISGAPILGDQAGYRIDECLIIQNDSTIVFRKDPKGESDIKTKVQPTGSIWKANTVVELRSRISASDVEYIGSWMEGKSFQVRWEFCGQAHMNPRHGQIFWPLPFRISSDIIPEKDLPTISPEVFDEQFATCK